MPELPNLLARFQIPHSNHVVAASREDCLSIRQQADRGSAVGVFAQNKAFIALTLTPPVAPLPVPQIGFRLRSAGPGFWKYSLLPLAAASLTRTRPVAVQSLECIGEVVRLDSLLHQLHV